MASILYLCNFSYVVFITPILILPQCYRNVNTKLTINYVNKNYSGSIWSQFLQRTSTVVYGEKPHFLGVGEVFNSYCQDFLHFGTRYNEYISAMVMKDFVLPGQSSECRHCATRFRDDPCITAWYIQEVSRVLSGFLWNAKIRVYLITLNACSQ